MLPTCNANGFIINLGFDIHLGSIHGNSHAYGYEYGTRGSGSHGLILGSICITPGDGDGDGDAASTAYYGDDIWE